MTTANNAVKTSNGNKAAAKAAATTKTNKGTLRVKGKGKAVISRFTPLTAVPVTAMADLSKVAPLLKKTGDLTAFGHKNMLSIAQVVDNAIVAMITGKQAIDSKALIEACFSAYTVTSRVDNASVAKQIDATFTKVASHLKGFNTALAHHNKYLKNRMAGKGYTDQQTTEICNGVWPVISALQVDMLHGKKGAKQHYANNGK